MLFGWKTVHHRIFTVLQEGNTTVLCRQADYGSFNADFDDHGKIQRRQLESGPGLYLHFIRVQRIDLIGPLW
jgi:hypothetical protein